MCAWEWRSPRILHSSFAATFALMGRSGRSILSAYLTTTGSQLDTGHWRAWNFLTRVSRPHSRSSRWPSHSKKRRRFMENRIKPRLIFLGNARASVSCESPPRAGTKRCPRATLEWAEYEDKDSIIFYLPLRRRPECPGVAGVALRLLRSYSGRHRSAK